MLQAAAAAEKLKLFCCFGSDFLRNSQVSAAAVGKFHFFWRSTAAASYKLCASGGG
jgi:hypothetical protein